MLKMRALLYDSEKFYYLEDFIFFYKEFLKVNKYIIYTIKLLLISSSEQ